ncbi:MAG: tetratricopeptide repeat protein, partial [Planctomycetes bacterium]|nr:tetratricopeptide repeat protein [Planctomycetota bacterium]
TTTVSPDITVSPQIDTSFKVGLDEEGVGQELGKRLDPLSAGIKALKDQLAQLAPKQPLPGSEDPLKIKAVEFFNAGVDAYKKDEIGQAIGHWLDALKLAPAYAHAHNNLGRALKEKGALGAAIEHCNAALRIEPDSRSVHYILGLALAAKGEHDAAIEHLGKAMGIEPDDADDHFDLSRVLAEKEDAAPAVAALARAIQLDPRYRDKAKTDKHYDPIRDDPAFRKLVDAE